MRFLRNCAHVAVVGALVAAPAAAAVGLSSAQVAACTTGVNNASNNLSPDEKANICIAQAGQLSVGEGGQGRLQTGTGPGIYVIAQSAPGGPGYAGISNYCGTSCGNAGEGQTNSGANKVAGQGDCGVGNPVNPACDPGNTGNTEPFSECNDTDTAGPDSGPADNSDPNGSAHNTPQYNSGGTVMPKVLCDDTIPVLAGTVGGATAYAAADTVEGTVDSEVYGIYIPVACGSTTSPSWNNTARNGCWV